MAEKLLSDLIDKKTIVGKWLTVLSCTEKVFSGYVMFIVNDNLVTRRVYDMKYNSDHDASMYVIFNKVKYLINTPLKPVSCAVNKDAFYQR